MNCLLKVVHPIPVVLLYLQKLILVRAEIDDQVFSARTLAEALMQLFSECKWLCKNTVQRLQKGFLATCKWLPARFRKTFRNIKTTSAAFQFAASFLTFRAYVAMLLTMLCLPTWTLLDFIA